jgi:hypothetical protein
MTSCLVCGKPSCLLLFILLSLWDQPVDMVERADWLDDGSLLAKFFTFAGYGPVSGGAPPTCRPPVTQAPASNGPTPTVLSQRQWPSTATTAAIVHPSSSMHTAKAHSHHSSHIWSTAAPCSLNIPLATQHHSITIPMGWAGHQCPPDSGPPVYQQRWKVWCENMI